MRLIVTYEDTVRFYHRTFYYMNASSWDSRLCYEANPFSTGEGWGVRGGGMRRDKREDRWNETNDHKRRRDGKKAEGDSERRGKKMQQNGKLEGRRWKGIEWGGIERGRDGRGGGFQSIHITVPCRERAALSPLRMAVINESSARTGETSQTNLTREGKGKGIMGES